MKKFFVLWISLAAFIISTDDLTAGRLYARRAGTEAPIYNIAITHIRTSIRIWNQLAVTHVDEEFYNDNNLVLEGFYAFTLPEGSKVDGLWLWVDGKRLTFIVKKKEDAERMYDSVVIGVRRDPAILESLGANRFQLKVWPINPKSSRRIEIQYFNTLPIGDDGKVHYTYPLNNLTYQSVPVLQTEMYIDLRGEQKISSVTTNFDDRPLMNRLTKIDDRHSVIAFGIENANYTEDYHLSFRLESPSDIFPILTYANPAAPNDDAFFMMWLPLHAIDTVVTQPRDYCFVLDASGSMAGSRINGVKTAYEKILRALRPIDRYRIVLFASNAISYPADTTLLDATPENVSKTIDFINRNYLANGGTNYMEAFVAGLRARYRPEAERRMIFLTDGEPTIGATDYATIIATIKAVDTYSVRIFPVLLYTSSIKLLYDIAADRWGKVTNIEQNDDIGTVISRLILDLSMGGFKDLSVRFAQNIPFDVYPRTFGDLTGANELICSGRFTTDGTDNATLSYRNASGSMASTTRNVPFLRAHSSLVQVSRYWASKKIDALLDDIKKYGEKTELKNSVIALSQEYMILTPYTAFLVLETNPIDPTDVAAEGTVAENFSLRQNYPNPFGAASPSRSVATNISFTAPGRAHVKIVIYDVLGRVVRILADRTFERGSYSLLWDGRDGAGNAVGTGAYFCVLASGQTKQLIRMTLIR